MRDFESSEARQKSCPGSETTDDSCVRSRLDAMRWWWWTSTLCLLNLCPSFGFFFLSCVVWHSTFSSDSARTNSIIIISSLCLLFSCCMHATKRPFLFVCHPFSLYFRHTWLARELAYWIDCTKYRLYFSNRVVCLARQKFWMTLALHRGSRGDCAHVSCFGQNWITSHSLSVTCSWRGQAGRLRQSFPWGDEDGTCIETKHTLPTNNESLTCSFLINMACLIGWWFWTFHCKNECTMAGLVGKLHCALIARCVDHLNCLCTIRLYIWIKWNHLWGRQIYVTISDGIYWRHGKAG